MGKILSSPVDKSGGPLACLAAGPPSYLASASRLFRDGKSGRGNPSCAGSLDFDFELGHRSSFSELEAVRSFQTSPYPRQRL